MTDCRFRRTTAYWFRHPTRYCILGVRAVWEAIDGRNLEPWEQSLLIKQMAGILNESRPSPVQRLNARDVIAAARSFGDDGD